MEKTSAISITLYDMSGAPINPYTLHRLEDLVEKLAKEENLVINVSKAE